ncbi:cystathionine beta-synthase/cysteine synthase A [Paenarthrobacter nicotinovorans]|uniref:PLP-dependent cysteine synthase family protein n=1 Tax=Paenarthrobacter nicotinovorans TaxID=29320 RepID=UPI002783C76D|nr:cysteine synthase family protein [Paenarthrobacter nicotinovorans]MDP9937705.1 cystathionine beta-synthase/cysteine synthase A [Paenarthrobacter nicotinovorans]
MSTATRKHGLHAMPAALDGLDASVLDKVGNTPLVKLEALSRGLGSSIHIKLESENPGGSIKDRTALSMVRAAERSGELQPGATIVESTSGNTGIGLALIGHLTGHPVVVVTGDTISQEKLAALHNYGARVILTDWNAPSESPENARAVAARITEETPGAWRPMQFDNPANPLAHYETTGPEIWEQTGGLVTHFVAGIGTGGTISGNGRYLKEQVAAARPGAHLEVVGADPYGSAYSGGHPGKILVDGVGNSWPQAEWPKIFDRSIVDRFLRIPNDEVYSTVHRLLDEEGLALGPSSGLAVAAAIRVARAAPHGSVVVAIAPDAGTNYMSKAFNPVWLAENGIRLSGDIPDARD